MQAKEVIRAMIEDSGISQRQVSLSMGRSGHFISSVLGNGRMPNIELMAEMADSAGFDLVLRNRHTGNEIQIDPPDNLPSQRD